MHFAVAVMLLPVAVYISGLVRKCWLTCKREYSQSCCACKQPVWNIVLIRKWTLILNVTGLQLKVLSMDLLGPFCVGAYCVTRCWWTLLCQNSLSSWQVRTWKADNWTNALLKKDSTSSHRTTPHTPPVVSGFEGLCRWHAVCRNVCWGHSPQNEGSFHTYPGPLHELHLFLHQLSSWPISVCQMKEIWLQLSTSSMGNHLRSRPPGPDHSLSS